MKITVQYFAALREQRGLSQESIETSAADAASLYDELRIAHGLKLTAAQLKVAINDAFAEWDTPLAAGDTVVFIPPVAGG